MTLPTIFLNYNFLQFQTSIDSTKIIFLKKNIKETLLKILQIVDTINIHKIVVSSQKKQRNFSAF